MSRPTLVYTPHGTAEFYRDGKLEWSSDDDEEFADEQQNEFLSDVEDTDQIIDWLIDLGLIDDDEEIDIDEQALGDESDDEDEDDE